MATLLVVILLVTLLYHLLVPSVAAVATATVSTATAPTATLQKTPDQGLVSDKLLRDKVLPAIGSTVSLAQIENICLAYQLPALWQKISQDPPAKSFVSDGCTKWFDEWRDKSLYPACLLHDLKYWSGYPGENLARLQADADLMLDVANILQDTVMAEAMFHGVRIGGTEKLQAAFSWGFGRQ